ncbi:hypothetical protein SD80_012850 [Scytonema tolypothrichoides VB-61278]|nr:hypothetical protein SD80_012850 [Scytonema tolypothrichoides VB-61278]
MSVSISRVKAILAGNLPVDVVNAMLDEYIHIKQQFFLRKFRPTELNAARFSEYVLRLLQYIDTGNYTPLGVSLQSQSIINAIGHNATIPNSLRVFIPRLIRVILDVRNQRDVAHVGGEVNPNVSDSLLVVHSTDWILTELIRHFHNCSIQDAQMIVDAINEIKIPIITEVEGFIRVQNTKLDAKKKTLVILYHKSPSKVLADNLAKWIRYSNPSRFKSELLKQLDDEAMIHYEGGYCTLLDKGVLYVEKHIPLELLV